MLVKWYKPIADVLQLRNDLEKAKDQWGLITNTSLTWGPGGPAGQCDLGSEAACIIWSSWHNSFISRASSFYVTQNMSECAAMCGLLEKCMKEQPPNTTGSGEFVCSNRVKPRICHKFIFTDAWAWALQHSVLPHASSSSFQRHIAVGLPHAPLSQCATLAYS